MCVCAKGNPEGTRQTEISQLQVTFSIDEQILRLQITVENAM
jgi:hypothetical protein